MIAALALLALALAGGCGGSSGGSAPAAKVYKIGELHSALASHLPAVFDEIRPFDGRSTDGAVMISLNGVTPAVFAEYGEVFKEAYDNGHAIILEHADAAEIAALLDTVGHEHAYYIPGGDGHVELFAVEKRNEGLCRWTTPHSGGGDGDTAEQNEETGLTRAQNFKDWLDSGVEDYNPSGAAAAQSSAARSAISASADGESKNITDISGALIDRLDFSPNYDQKTLIVTYTRYSCHSFSENRDYFYIEQKSSLNPQKGYSQYVKDRAFYPVEYHVEGFVKRYRFSNRLPGAPDGQTASLATSSPNTENGALSITSSVAYNVGGSVGLASTGPNLDLNAGVTIGKSYTVDVKDCTVTNESGAGIPSNADWGYEMAWPRMRQPVERDGVMRIWDAVPLSRTNFQPVNCWIWSVSDGYRQNTLEAKPAFKSEFTWTDGKSVKMQAEAEPRQSTINPPGAQSADITVPLPPLVAANTKEVTYPAGGGDTKTIEFYSQGEWKISSDQPWCTVDAASGGDAAKTPASVHVVVSRNDTGTFRTACLTISTREKEKGDSGKPRGVSKIKIFQSQYNN